MIGLRKVLDRWRALPSQARWIAVAVAVLLVYNAIAFGIDAVDGGASDGPVSSSYTTASSGTAALADLLESSGYEVERLRRDVGEAGLDPGDTLFVLDPGELTGEDPAALGRFVRLGGRLVVSVDAPAQWLSEVVPEAPEWSPDGTGAHEPFLTVVDTAGVASATSDATGSWSEEEGSLPLLGDDSVTSLSVARDGEGAALLLADSSLLHNRNLDEADNAPLALGIAGSPDRTVVFAESYHGYTEAKGFGALPPGAKWALAGLVLATALLMLSYGRRFGPPQLRSRDLPPPRRAYVEAVANSLGRTRDPKTALEPLRRRAHRLAERRHAYGYASTGEEPDDEVKALLDKIDGDDVVAAGTASARLTRGEL